MSKKNELLPEDTIIVFGKISVGEYRKFFLQAIGEEILGSGGMDFQNWVFSQGGKTLKEATEEYFHPSEHEKIKDFLTERRFKIVSKTNKELIIAFDKAISEMGYDFGGTIRAGHSWGSQMMIIYGKTGTKSRPCAARIWIKTDDVLFQIYFNNIDAHRQYIEAAPDYIREVFTGSFGTHDKGCTSCRGSRCGPKEFTIDGHFKGICRDAPFFLKNISLKRLPEYMDLFSEFYEKK